MKKIIVLLMSVVLSVNCFAQGGFGGRGGGGFGGGGMGGPPGGGFGGGERRGGPPRGMQAIEETPVIESFPEINGLTEKQKKYVEKILIDEHKSVRTLKQQKRSLFRKDDDQMRRGNDIGIFLNANMPPADMQANMPPPDLDANPEDIVDPNMTPKQLEKARLKAAKIDDKIKKKIEKSNGKIAKKLTSEQYEAFLAKRGEFRFGIKRPNMPQQYEGRKPGERTGSIGPPEN
ncbi:MAG: hypothetical protein LBR84_09915 [Tannerella sp.]|jgi:hypothetical protein|nr:hypothetical protein [Tannerella sp.]